MHDLAAAGTAQGMAITPLEMAMTGMAMFTLLMVFALLTVVPLSAQEVDEATKAWALRRAYQLNGDNMNGCRLRGDGEWNCHSIDLGGEIRNAQSGPRPDLIAPVVEQMPSPPTKKKK